jgi:aminoglycoside/choline kinase family phosphotransferase
MAAPDVGPVIGALADDVAENEAFLAFTEAFRSAGLPVPEIYAVHPDRTAYLLTDLGDTTLFGTVAAIREREGVSAAPGAAAPLPEEALALYRRVVGWLPRFQVIGAERIDFSLAYPHASFGERSIRWDLNYFKYLFLKLAHVPFDEARLEADFSTLAEHLADAPADYFLYRDFQSRNVLIVEGDPWFIDYQGGRRGALQYDVASLLYDAKAGLSEQTRSVLLDAYLEALAEYVDVPRTSFLRYYRPFVLVRILQAMGAYGYRGFYERKQRFLTSVPYAVANLAAVLDAGPLGVELPELEAVLRRIIARPDFAPEEGSDPGLTVSIGSFSYKGGIPADDAGHGGGFVFDCRVLPNPGRREEYRDLTGLDPSVGAFLDDLPEAGPFWDSVVGLVDAAVDGYQRRGFRSLTVRFGCTGGQHRSVYFAERLAAHLAPRVRVRVEHREREQWPAAPGASGGAEGPARTDADGGGGSGS